LSKGKGRERNSPLKLTCPQTEHPELAPALEDIQRGRSSIKLGVSPPKDIIHFLQIRNDDDGLLKQNRKSEGDERGAEEGSFEASREVRQTVLAKKN